MQLPSRAPLKISPRPDFRPEDFRKLIFHRGMDCTWEQAQECPCRRKVSELSGSRFGTTPSGVVGETTEPRQDCPLCEGDGYFYHSSQSVKALVTRASSTPELFTVFGEMARGTSYFTLLPEHIPQPFDRFTLVNSVLTFRETRIKTAATVEALRYPIVTRSLDLSTGLTSVGVLQLQLADSTGQTSLALARTAGVDFAIDSQGRIDWSLGVSAGTAPATGDRYAISYYASPRYVVLDNPHTHRDTFIKVKSPTIDFAPLPVQCMAQLDFLGDAP